MPDPTTAAELHALVELWPKEARPMNLTLNPANSYGETLGWESDGEFISDAHAIDLHVASGLRWMLTKGHVGIKDIGQVRVVVSFPAPRDPVIEYSKIGGTLIEALHAAIMATAKEGA